MGFYALFNSNRRDESPLEMEGVKDALELCPNSFSWSQIDKFIARHRGQYIAVILSYDLKNEVETLHARHLPGPNHPLVVLVVPEKAGRREGDFQPKEKPVPVKVRPAYHEEAYNRHFATLRHHIHQGDIYEANFCVPFYSEEIELDPRATYARLNQLSEAPYSALIQWKNRWSIGASPELYLEKKGNRLVSSPIKGTRPRHTNPKMDAQYREALLTSEKERSENVMIVDLVRNDLSRIAEKGTVKVEELFGVYPFRTVHQMISTIACSIPSDLPFSDIIRHTFPMGSMTGAPKISAMQIIDQHEPEHRGWYSGSQGFIDPSGDFRLNVVIRTLFYDLQRKRAWFWAGSAVTALANAGEEYAECLLKARAMLDAIHGQLVD